MRVLVINGSPKGENSNTLLAAKAFCSGLPEPVSIQTIHLAKLHIRPCLGCFGCWNKTPGQCVQQDDMNQLYQAVRDADLILESFPLYFFGMPGLMKNMTDRMLPMTTPYLGGVGQSEHFFHEIRDPALAAKKLVLISSCGYGEGTQLFEALRAQYDLICGKDNYTALFCPQGELLAPFEHSRRVEHYFSLLAKAGSEWAQTEKVSDETLQQLTQPIFNQKAYELVVRTRFGSGATENTLQKEESTTSHEKIRYSQTG